MAGALIFDAIAFLIMTYTGVAAHYAGGSMRVAAGLILMLTMAYLTLSGVIGSLWGKSERAEKERLWRIEAHNMKFLDDNGFQELGLGDEFIEDADGHRLKLKEQEGDRILFTVVGRRNVRAAIILDGEGRMVDYTGAVKL